MGKLVDSLRHDYPRLLDSEPDLSLFTETMEFSGGSLRVRGLERYKSLLSSLRWAKKVAKVDAEVGTRIVLSGGAVRVRWTCKVGGAVVDGISVYELTVRGHVKTHRLENIATHGGDLGWFAAGYMQPEFEEATLALAVGPQYTYVKLAAIALLGLLAFMIFVKGPDRVEAPFTIETITKQVVPAPYDGFIKHVNVEPGDRVAADQTVLATLDTQELEAKLAELRAQWATHRKEADIARQERKESQVQIADARAGLIALPSDETLTLGAFRGLSEDHAVLIASLEHSPLTDVLDSGRPALFELPETLPGDDPAAWTLSEAGLTHGIALPLLRGKRKSIRGVALLATRRAPAVAAPAILEQASRAAAEALAVHDSLARSRDEKRSAALRLNRQTHDAAHLYRVLRELSHPRDLARVARNLSEALQILLTPDLVAVYAHAGGLRYQDLREAHPLPLRSVTAFERWFHSRILQTFGEEALDGCIPTGSSSGGSSTSSR